MRLIHLKLAARNVRRQPHRTIALGGAVAFSALVMALISGFVNGMDLAIQDNVTLYSGGHVLISGYTASWSGKLQNRFSDANVAKIVESTDGGIRTVSPIAQSRATVVFGTREIQLTLRGVDWTKDQLYHDSLILSKGDWKGLESSRTMLMSAQTANRFGLSVGDQVVVRLNTASGQQNVTDYKVAAIYDDGAAGGMNTGFVAFGDLTADLNMKSNEQQQIAVFLKNSADAEKAAQTITGELSSKGFTVSRGAAANAGASNGTPSQDSSTGSDSFVSSITAPASSGTGASGARQGMGRLSSGTAIYHVSTIQELAGEIGSALGSVRWIGYAVFLLMLIVSATGISNSYRMVLLERTKEIGMLRCIGYKKKDVFSSFIWEGILLAGGAALVGVVLALPIGFGIGLIPFNPHGDFGAALVQGHLRFAPILGQFLLILVFVTIVAIAAVFLPARKAAEVVPVEALRKTA
jgi:ABC-type lipoprotein release transport system permease subunit